MLWNLENQLLKTFKNKIDNYRQKLRVMIEKTKSIITTISFGYCAIWIQTGYQLLYIDEKMRNKAWMHEKSLYFVNGQQKKMYFQSKQNE